MPENQSQPRTGGYGNPGGEPKLSPQPDKPAPERPSDTEAAHAPEEGRSVSDPRLTTPEQRDSRADQNFGSLEGHPQRDKRGDYGAQGMKGTDAGTAGAEFADRMDPDAVRTQTDSEDGGNPH